MTEFPTRNNKFISLASMLALAACSIRGQGIAPPMTADSALQYLNQTGAGKIKHVVWIVQENRSFNDIFMGFPGAETATSGKSSSGRRITLKPVSLKVTYDIDHSAGAMFDACNGQGTLPGTDCKMDHFDKEPFFGGPRHPQYVYVPHNESKPYWDIAHEFVLADHMFQSQLDESFVAHQYIIAAQAASAVNIPRAQWGCSGDGLDQVQMLTHDRHLGQLRRACFNYDTLGDELDKAGLEWRFYTSQYTDGVSGYWSGYQAVKHIFNGPDWKRNIVTPQKRFLSDIAAGKLASFTWITPQCRDSDHLSCGTGGGPSWVASLVNAVGESKFWDSTVVFIQWDDWGGVYDPVPPPFLGYDSTGFRVPLMVVSAYAKKNYVSHVQYETTSVLHFAEDLFGLPRMTQADRRATSPAGDCLDFTQKPRKFVPIKAPLDGNYFLYREPTDNRIPDSDF